MPSGGGHSINARPARHRPLLSRVSCSSSLHEGCDEPETLDKLLIIADKYATADSSMKAEIQFNVSSKVAPQAPRTPAGDSSRRQQPNDNKRKASQLTSSSRQVATVEDQQPEGKPPTKRQKGGKSNWLPAFPYEQTLDGPCKFHSGAKPSNHTTRKCH